MIYFVITSVYGTFALCYNETISSASFKSLWLPCSVFLKRKRRKASAT